MASAIFARSHGSWIYPEPSLLRIGGVRHASDAPWFVADKDMRRNAIVVVQGHDHPLLYRHDVEAIDMHWIAGHERQVPARLLITNAISS